MPEVLTPLALPQLDLSTDWSSSAPAVPATGLTMFALQRSGRRLPASISPSGLASALQPALFANSIRYARARGNGGNIDALGFPSFTVVGTSTSRSVASTTLSTAIAKLAVLSGGTAGSLAELWYGVAQHFRGNAAGLGGFSLVCRFLNDTNASTGDRMFVGLRSSPAAATNVEPSSLTNIIGVGFDAADANLQIMVNDGVGTATKTDLGANFAKATLTNVYELRLFVAPNSTTLYWSMDRLDTTGALVEGNTTLDLPAVNTLLGFKMWKSNNATALATGLAFASLYIETDT